MKISNLIIHWPFLSYATCCTEILSSPIWQTIKARGFQKSQLSNSLVNWEKFGSAGQSQFSISIMIWEKLGNIHSSRPTFQNSNFESMDEMGKVMY